MLQSKMYYEIAYLCEKYGLTAEKAERLIKKYGPIREQIEKHIRH